MIFQNVVMKAVAAMQTDRADQLWTIDSIGEAPAGSVNRKKGRDATVDINDSTRATP